ncbi:MAG TPA: hypothetical protein PKE49_08645 [Leptospiraceae bacterium]|nr:hypothetical protein [Leptospirales bacterium]HMU83225.1 hypothetical protein [Leptospiraceae bacterium]HMX56579.1 hypothetical protein [Leptospiraceae bacterium]HMY47012.1 hypothetical protein [Leptospiraceae bacterium]HMZ38219.1 hypothetical protein [Leptospiraceae bacterium]
MDQSQTEEILSPEDPTAIYREVTFTGPAVTFYDRLARAAHANKRKIYFLMLCAIVVPIFLGLRSTRPLTASRIATDYFDRFRTGESNGVYSVAGATFGQDHLRHLFDAVGSTTLGPAGLRQLDGNSAAYTAYVRDQFETDLLVHAALQEGVLDSPQASFFIENSMRHSMADYYLLTRIMRPDTNLRVVVSDQAVQSYYEKNREQYAKSGLPQKETMEIIRRTLEQIQSDQMQAQIRLLRQQTINSLKDRGEHHFTGVSQ